MTEKKPAKKQPAKKVPAKKAPAKKPTAKTPAKKTPAKTSNSSTPAKKRGRPPKTAATSAAPTQPEIVINVTTKHSTNHIKNFFLNTYRKLVKTNQKRG